MYYRHHQFDVAHTLTTYFFLCYFHTATVAHDAFITDTLVLSAGTLIILHRSENTLAKQTITLRLVRTIVDGFGFQHFAIATLQNRIGRGQTNFDLIKCGPGTIVFFDSHML